MNVAQCWAHGPPARAGLARAYESREAELATLDAHGGQVWQATFSPDGTRVMTAGTDAAVHIWDVATGRELYALRDHRPPVVAAWSPGGEIATADATGEVRLWTADARPRARIPGESRVPTWIAFSNDGARFAVARPDGNVAIGDLRSGELRARWQADPTRVEQIDFDPSSSRVVTAGDQTTIVWSIEGRELARLEGHTAHVWHAVFDPTGERIITASLDATARIWDARTGAVLHKLQGHEERVTNVAIDGSARRIATTSADTTVRVWSLDTGEPLATLRGHTAQVNSVSFAPDDQLVTASNDGTARVWGS